MASNGVAPIITDSGTEPLSFEQALTRLEGIVRKLEEGGVPLEDGLTAFEEGIVLSRLCQERLDRAEKRVEELMDQLPSAGGVADS
ncbi:MAG: exodeoxyribonuclease VII small subunit [Magnetococcales bacterium]|nr:exodeoxyribonuclease VII small subunit [Magnetococcales bacterium]